VHTLLDRVEALGPREGRPPVLGAGLVDPIDGRVERAEAALVRSAEQRRAQEGIGELVE
jgi:hypothetical protein